MSQTKQNWIRYTELLKQKLPDFYAALGPGVTEERFAQAEEKMLEKGIVFPQELKDIYSVHGREIKSMVEGSVGFSLHMFPTYPPFEDWEENMEGSIISVPEGYVKILYNSKNWIPFLNDGVGGSLCIDLDPGEKGKVGQIISFSSDDDNRVVFADSLADFLQFLINKLETDDYVVEESESGRLTLLFTKVDFDEKDWDEVGGYNVAMMTFGEVDADNDLSGKRKIENAQSQSCFSGVERLLFNCLT